MTLTTTTPPATRTTELAYGSREAAAACVDVLREVVAGLDPDVLLASEAPEVWGVFDEIERLGAAGKVLVARRVEASSAWKDAGMRSAAEYLALRGGTTREAARDALKTSQRVTSQPQVRDALRRGALSGAQAHAIADAVSHDPTSESALVDHAKVASMKELRDECLRRKAAADPKPEDTRERIHKDRRFRLRTDAEGAWCFSGRGPLDHVGIFSATLNPLIDEEFKKARASGRREDRQALAYDALQEMARLARAAYYDEDLADNDSAESDAEDLDTDGDEHVSGDGSVPGTTDDQPLATNGPGNHERDARPAVRQDNVADGDVSGRGHPAGGPQPSDRDRASEAKDASRDDWQPPLLGQEADEDRGADPADRVRRRRSTPRPKKRRKRLNPSHLAILRLDIDALRRGYTQGDELCEIAGLGPIPANTARGLLGDSILKLVLAKGTAVASTVHLGRGPNAAQRVALLWSQPECSVEGCCHTFTQTDHRHEWHKAKVTELHNLDRLCHHHHALKTHQNWALVVGTGKRPMVPPDDPRHPGHPSTSRSKSPSDVRTPNPLSTARNGNPG